MTRGTDAIAGRAALAAAPSRPVAAASRAARDGRFASGRRAGGGVTGRATRVLLLVASTLVGSAPAGAADIVLRNAWMRPAPAGAESARVYVDIQSDVAVDLAGATTPIARKVEIVRTGTIGDPATEKVVPTYAVPARTAVRLAYRGDHLRLVGLTRDASNGEPVPLVLVFTDAAGKRTEASVEVTVRGLLMPGQMPATPHR